MFFFFIPVPHPCSPLPDSLSSEKQIGKQFTPGIERKRLQRVIAEANRYVQTLNDAYTDPSGDEVRARPAVEPPKVVPLPAKSSNPETSSPGA